MTRKRPKKRSKPKPLKKWSKFELYQESVQNPSFEVEFLSSLYRRYRKERATTLREDFCGTAILCAEWVKSVKGGRAIGLDLDEPTLQWGIEHNINPLGKKAERVQLLRRDVLDATDLSADIVAAFNFSYCIFKQRKVLKKYFERVRESLAPGGIFVLDLYGGPEAQVAQEESTEQDPGFDYVWDQDHFNPVTGETLCYIHFDLPDGTRFERAFEYDWRLWTLPEVQDLLWEVGFDRVDVFWEGTDEDGEGDGEFTLSREGDDASAWVAYIVGAK